MPNNITKIADYFGETQLVFDAKGSDQFDQFVEDVEKQILRGDNINDYGLLGDQVYIALIADLDSNNDPQTTKYINLVNGKTYIQTDGRNTLFCGIKKMLTFFVYSEWIKNNMMAQSVSGSLIMKPINATNALKKDVNYEAHKRWNKGVDLYNREVYEYILFNQSDFTNWQFTKQSKYLTKGII